MTIYELVLGAGDYELAQMVQPYFSKIKDGEQHMIRQYERYKSHIDGMLTQEPYNLAPLIGLIKNASAEDVVALIKNDMTHQSELRDAMIQFRKDWAPRILTEPCMHYNYASLQYAFELLDDELANLDETNDNECCKILLVWKLIGFEMRRLPGIDRCVIAQGLYYVIDKCLPVERSYNFKNIDDDFPITVSDDDVGGGLDGDFYCALERSLCELSIHDFGVASARWSSYVVSKILNLQNLCPHDQHVNRLGV